MSNKKIECVYFDIGRTLVGFELERFAKGVSEYTNLDAEAIVQKVFKEEPYFSLEKGLVSDDDFIQQIVEKIEARGLSKEKFIEAFISIFFFNEGIVEVLSEVRKKAKIVFISNLTSMHWENHISRRLVVKKFFAEPWQQVLSFKVGARKPDEKIFKEAFGRVDVQPENTLFFDDKQENVEGFRALGGNAEVYDCTKNSTEELVSFLKEYEAI